MKRLLLASLSVIAVTTVCHADLAAASANAVPGHYLDLKCTVDTARRVIVLPAVEGGADVAVAMLDRRITTPDTLTTIASQLLLQSDLQGHIEDAAWYLRAPAQEALPAADALMLTQGWTRYDIPAVISGTINDSLPYPLEIGAQLDGVIRSKWRGKPLAGVTANIIIPKMAAAATATTDSIGHFKITGIDWPDSTQFIVSAWNSKGRREENFGIEADNFPMLSPIQLPAIYGYATKDYISNDNFITRVTQSPQGIMVSLREVTVAETKPMKLNNIVATIASASFNPSDDPSVNSYEDALRKVPGINIEGDWAHYRGKSITIWVDGRYIGHTAIHYNERISKAITNSDIMAKSMRISDLEGLYPFKENESVSYIDPILSTLFRHGKSQGGVLYITTLNPAKTKNTLSVDIRTFMPLGYQKSKKFYVPKYTPDGIAEDQTGAALRWLPSIDLSHSIELPIPPNMTADDVTISAEGLTSNNEIIIVQY